MSQSINELLMEAIAAHNVQSVKKWLESSADANYRRFRDEDDPDGIIQPTTPLRLVMFCISDSLLTDEDLKDLMQIAKLLLQAGADPKPAMEIAEARYGKYDPDMEITPFTEVWHLVAGHIIEW